MRLTRTLCFFLLNLNTVQYHAQTIEGYSEFPITSTKWDTQVSNEVRPWLDSLHYRFMIVEFTGIPTNPVPPTEDFFRDPYYSYFNGPIFLKDDRNCTIYPMFSKTSITDTVSQTKSMQAYFCLDDFKMLSDSVTVYCRGYNGFANQSQMNNMHLTKRLKKKESWFVYEEDKSYPLATEKWFQKWRKDNWGEPHTRIWYLDKRHYCD